ncbi:MAG TPA: hypothetical protein VFF23_10365 [Hanamia sp.]|jgi:glycopeptide antibiotics resistance protein|nr:hypothetical protein [Hanamia sp.]
MIKLAPDKKKHFWVGMLMGAIFHILVIFFLPQNFWLSILITFILIVALCYGFELFSLITKLGHYEVMDAIAGIIGGVIGMGVILLLQYIRAAT